MNRIAVWLIMACMVYALGGCGVDHDAGAPASAPRASPQAELPSMPAMAAPVLVQVPERNAWRLQSVAGLVLPEGARRPTLALDAETRSVAGFAGVNRYTGSYELGADMLSFAALAATKMAGPPELMAMEQIYLQALSQVDGWRMREQTLELHAAGTRVLTFVPLIDAAP